MEEILVKEYRGELLECIHKGHICIVSENGVYKSVGDSDYVTFMRSSAKPIQVIPLIKRKIHEKYGFNDKEITVMAGSHRAEPFHVKALEGIMEKTGIKEEELVCLPTYPLSQDAKEELLRKNMGKRRIYHNCSGKHLGILTLCKSLGVSTEDYWDIKNPVQQEILSHIELLSGSRKGEVKTGTDGCGVPVFALPMKKIAEAYLKLACPDLIEDEETRAAVSFITKHMNKNYEMVSGTNLICSLLLMDDNIVAKGGAKGVYCFGLKKERLGIAIKVIDGSEEEWPLIVISILEQLHYDNKETIERMKKCFPSDIKNDNNKIVGFSKTVFNL